MRKVKMEMEMMKILESDKVMEEYVYQKEKEIYIEKDGDKGMRKLEKKV